jgi:TRAP-type C4-dicarboxylate transport system permease small subunit
MAKSGPLPNFASTITLDFRCLMIALVERIERGLLSLSIISGFATLLVILIVVTDVSGRFLLNLPFHSGVELSELLLVILVFLGLAAAQQQRQNYAIDILTRHFPQWLQRLFELAGYVTCLCIVILLGWPSSKQAFASFARGESGFGIVPFPLWPARVILAMGLWLLAVQFLCDIYRHVAGIPRQAIHAAPEKAFE